MKEIEIAVSAFQKDHKMPDLIETIYIGGGTPSLCTKEEIQAILRKVNSLFEVSIDAEITLEANPDDITETKLRDWKEAGVNRLSIGVQSFFDEDLQWMNRAHSASQATGSLQLAARQFNNITIDLIYGTPGLTNQKWKQNVEKTIALNISHISCYALTVEPKTPLQKLIQQHRSEDIDPAKQSEQFLLLMEWLEDAGYEHYEISNFAKPGFRSRHNSSYWQGKKYYGFGPSAHSFDGGRRWWNISNNSSYIRSVNTGVLPFEKEELSLVQKINEYIMTSLRTSEGLSLEEVKKIVQENKHLATERWQDEPTLVTGKILNQIKKYLDLGVLINKNDYFILTKEGKLLADGIAVDLFLDQ